MGRAIGARVQATTDSSSSPPSGVLSFDASPSSEIVARARFMDLPFEIKIDPSFPTSRIYLGSRMSNPPSSDTPIHLGDRHGAAFADFNRDGITDIYIANGGNRGAIRRFGTLATDQLLIGNGDGTFTDRIEGSGLSKGLCRGRYATPVDYDGDGNLDLFIGCEKIHPLLYAQQAPGKFGSRSHLLSAANVRGDLYRWIDLNGDGDQELIAVRKRQVRVYDYSPSNRSFINKQLVLAPGSGKNIDSLTIGDADGDQDPDLFIGSRGGNVLMINRGGKLRAEKPGALGLPNRGTVAGSFVDFNNDGRLDFHAVPQGLFLRQRGKHYERTDTGRVGGRARFASASWVDVDNDGDRDLVSALKRSGAKLRTRLSVNRTKGGHWMEIDLIGPKGNAQAIGAHVTVTAGGRKQTQWVGQAEGSRYASGHYRTYFGLGRAGFASSVQVTWPDGSVSRFDGVDADRLYRLSYPAG